VRTGRAGLGDSAEDTGDSVREAVQEGPVVQWRTELPTSGPFGPRTRRPPLRPGACGWLSRGTIWLETPKHRPGGASRRHERAPALRTLRPPERTALAGARSTRRGPAQRRQRPARSPGPRSGSCDRIDCLLPREPPTAIPTTNVPLPVKQPISVRASSRELSHPRVG
jgi:hypothetical protein